jgi:hypothetical protein
MDQIALQPSLKNVSRDKHQEAPKEKRFCGC